MFVLADCTNAGGANAKKDRISWECFKSVNQSGVWDRAQMADVVIFGYAIKPNQKKQMKAITPTEKKVLELIAGGYSTSDVATALDISKYTVLSHRRSLLGKFGVNNSVQLVTLAIKNRIIDVHDPQQKSAQ